MFNRYSYTLNDAVNMYNSNEETGTYRKTGTRIKQTVSKGLNKPYQYVFQTLKMVVGKIMFNKESKKISLFDVGIYTLPSFAVFCLPLGLSGNWLVYFGLLSASSVCLVLGIIFKI